MVCPLCIFMFSPFYCFLCRLQHHKREERKQRYPVTVPPPLLYFCTIWVWSGLVFVSLNQDSFVHCDFLPPPESEIRARLQSASPTAGRCKTSWDTLIHLLLVRSTLMKQQSTFIWGILNDFCLLLLRGFCYKPCPFAQCSVYDSNRWTVLLLQLSFECLSLWNFNW